MSQGSQFRLLAQRRFLPFFGAQALGAFNDNVYKNVLVILATYQAATYTTLDARAADQYRRRAVHPAVRAVLRASPASSPIATTRRWC